MSKHTLESAERTLRRCHVSTEYDEDGNTCHVLPADGVGIKCWGVIDYLRRHHKRTFRRHRR